jgi:hypothetical protein
MLAVQSLPRFDEISRKWLNRVRPPDRREIKFHAELAGAIIG